MFEPIATYVGNIGSEIRSGTGRNGDAWASFALAVSPKDKDDTGAWVDGPTTWVRVSAFKQRAEHIARTLSKGDRVVVVGRQRSGTYEKDGVQHSTLEVVADVGCGPDLMFDSWAKQSQAPSTGGGSAQPGGFESFGGGWTDPNQPAY